VIVAGLSAKPCIRVESGAFVGRFGEEEYALGSTEAEVARAIRRMSELRREIQAKVA
jgi:GGDEF domain-containing protein